MKKNGALAHRTNGYASVSVDIRDPSVQKQHKELVQFFKDMKRRQIMNKQELEKTGKKGTLILKEYAEDENVVHYIQIDEDKLRDAIQDPMDFEVSMESFDRLEISYITLEELAEAGYKGMIHSGNSEEDAQAAKKEILEDRT